MVVYVARSTPELWMSMTLRATWHFLLLLSKDVGSRLAASSRSQTRPLSPEHHEWAPLGSCSLAESLSRHQIYVWMSGIPQTFSNFFYPSTKTVLTLSSTIPLVSVAGYFFSNSFRSLFPVFDHGLVPLRCALKCSLGLRGSEKKRALFHYPPSWLVHGARGSQRVDRRQYEGEDFHQVGYPNGRLGLWFLYFQDRLQKSRWQ